MKLPKQYWGLIVCVTLWLVTNFYYPNQDTRQVQFMAWEFGCIFLFAVSQFFPSLRKNDNPFPALFLGWAVLSCFTHLMQEFTLIGLTQVLMFTFTYYALTNTLDREICQTIKKCIVLIAVANVVMGMMQYFGFSPVYDTKEVTGFISQKWNFGILCAVALPFAIEWNLLTTVILLVGVAVADKYACYIPLFLALFLNARVKTVSRKVSIPVLIAFIFAAMLKKTDFFHESLASLGHGEMSLKVAPRISHWKEVMHFSFGRPLDGYGFNSFSAYIRSTKANFVPEMHSEPLQVFFETGAIGVAIMLGWIVRIWKKSNIMNLDATATSLMIFAVASFFHSCFHAPNILFVFMIILAMWEVERGSFYAEENSHCGRPDKLSGEAETRTAPRDSVSEVILGSDIDI